MGIFSGVKAAGKVAAKSVDDAVGNKAVPTKVVDDVDGNTVYNDGLTPYVPPAKEYNDGLTPYTPPQAKEYNDGLTPYVSSPQLSPAEDSQSMTFSALTHSISNSKINSPKVQEIVESGGKLHLHDEIDLVYRRLVEETDLSTKEINALMFKAIPVSPQGDMTTLLLLERMGLDYDNEVLESLGLLPKTLEHTLEAFFSKPQRYSQETPLNKYKEVPPDAPPLFDSEEAEARALELGLDTPVFHATIHDFDKFSTFKSEGMWDSLGAHVGTSGAAEDRYDALSGLVGVTEGTDSVKIMSLVLDRGNELRSSSGMVMTESALLTVLEKMEAQLPRRSKGAKNLRAALRKAGYDTIPYYNEVEDTGSVSYIILNPSKVRNRTANFSKKHAVKSGLTLSAAGFLVKEGLEEEEAKVE